MKKLLLVLSVLLAANANAANINKGDWEVGGSFDLSHTSESYSFNNRTSLTILGDFQYFIKDRFSLGLGATYYTAGRNSSSGSVGPVATYYFASKSKWVPFVQVAPINWTKFDGLRATYSSAVQVGAKYFFTDSVAFGPALQYERVWPNSPLVGANRISFLGNFSIYL
jgi:hypothetical protein